MELAPIVLFVYNRLWHTQQTIEALQKNELAAESELIIYSDGPRTEADAAKVNAVREYIRTIDGFKSIKINESPVNKGLADSIISGVTEIVNQYGKIIVLEDDIVTSRYFLSYMNEALRIYKDEPKVMHITGYLPRLSSFLLPDAFFLRFMGCWGWATWKDRWSLYRRDIDYFESILCPADIKEFNFDGAYDSWVQIKLNKSREIKTWAIFWALTIFEQKGLSLFPKHSLVRNIGHDDSGEHCGKTNYYDVKLQQYQVKQFPASIEVNQCAFMRYRRFFLRQSSSKSLRQRYLLTKHYIKKMVFVIIGKEFK